MGDIGVRVDVDTVDVHVDVGIDVNVGVDVDVSEDVDVAVMLVMKIF